MPMRLSRRAYAGMYGPTTGDRLRLADTDLVIEVERDLTTYGEEVKFGGGKVIRDGMGQSQVTRARGAMDTVITNALILDHTGIYKADVGLRDGLIAAIGKAGNPDTQPGVTIVIGPARRSSPARAASSPPAGSTSTSTSSARSRSRRRWPAGVTTMFGGGTGPAHGTLATTCTPGPGTWSGCCRRPRLPGEPRLPRQGQRGAAGRAGGADPAGACGLKLHEDWGTTPKAIDTCLAVATRWTCRWRSTRTR
jgi:urease subunit alpha